MLIRSQDKKDLINLDKTYRLGYQSANNGWIVAVENQLTIGKYSTKARAIKVLDMIETRYHDIEMSKIPDYDTGWAPFTFQMPSDEEVEG